MIYYYAGFLIKGLRSFARGLDSSCLLATSNDLQYNVAKIMQEEMFSICPISTYIKIDS